MDPHSLAVIHGSGQSCYRTPPALVAKLPWTFAWDLAASAESSICQPDSTGMGHRWLGPGSTYCEDALSTDWALLPGGQVGFLNPPYSLLEIRARKAAGLSTTHLRIENWAKKAYADSQRGATTIGVFPYAPQTEWFRRYVMGHLDLPNRTVGWAGHAALDFWRIPHRVSYLLPDGSPTANAGVNTCIIHWGPNPGFVGPWVPSGRYWSYR